MIIDFREGIRIATGLEVHFYWLAGELMAVNPALRNPLHLAPRDTLSPDGIERALRRAGWLQ